MGSSSSSRRHASSLPVVSPRVEIAQTGKKNEPVLDSSPLRDVGHGAIHYRYQLPEHSVHDYSESEKEKLSVGYFFHPKLKDYSDAVDVENEDARKFIKVVKGPTSDENKNVFYITGIGIDGNTSAIPKSLSLGKDGQHEKKIFGHRYFAITNTLKQDGIDEPKILNGSIGEVTATSKDEVQVIVNENCSIKDLKSLLSHHLLIPISIIHILTSVSVQDESADGALIVDTVSINAELSKVILVTLSVM